MAQHAIYREAEIAIAQPHRQRERLDAEIGAGEQDARRVLVILDQGREHRLAGEVSRNVPLFESRHRLLEIREGNDLGLDMHGGEAAPQGLLGQRTGDGTDLLAAELLDVARTVVTNGEAGSVDESPDREIDLGTPVERLGERVAEQIRLVLADRIETVLGRHRHELDFEARLLELLGEALGDSLAEIDHETLGLAVRRFVREGCGILAIGGAQDAVLGDIVEGTGPCGARGHDEARRQHKSVQQRLHG